MDKTLVERIRKHYDSLQPAVKSCLHSIIMERPGRLQRFAEGEKAYCTADDYCPLQLDGDVKECSYAWLVRELRKDGGDEY